MTERPIIFSAPMVRAILEGRKTQTRRVLKPQPRNVDGSGRWYALPGGGESLNCHRLPFAVGDTLWVRETWYCDDYRVLRGPYLKPDDLDVDEARQDGTLVYASDGLRPYEAEQPIWKPSIHMPRWASRITVRVTGVKVEQLQDIREADAKAEGVTRPTVLHDDDGTSYVDAFRDLWFCIHGPGSWEANPWVAAISFEVMK
jgi:hypothetical protein